MSQIPQHFMITPRIRLRKKRLLPGGGEVVVQCGDRVNTEDVVALKEIEGRSHAFDMAARLGVGASTIVERLCVRAGETVRAGQVLAERESLFRRGRRQVVAPVGGVVESISSHSGKLLLREQQSVYELQASMAGVVTNVFEGMGVEIEGEISLVQGAFGMGGEIAGTLVVALQSSLADFWKTADPGLLEGGVVVAKQSLQSDDLKRLRRLGVAGVITGSMDGLDLMDFAGSFVNPASTGQEQIGITLMLTEGFGNKTMQADIFHVLHGLVGRRVVLNGTTQMRAGVVRPELVSEPLGDQALFEEKNPYGDGARDDRAY